MQQEPHQSIDANELVDNVTGLVTLPDVYVRISRAIESPKSSSADIAKAVSQDASFTVRLLKLANSALYSCPAKIDSVGKAITLIGIAQVRNLVLSMSVARSFAGLSNELVSMENFWKHSVLCALCARFLAADVRRCDPDAMFTAGLLHDIGELIIFNRLPEKASEALTMVLDSDEEVGVHSAEQAVMGFDHSTIGGLLARRWNLPSVLEECIAYHHDIASAKQHPREVALVHIANVCALMAEVDSLDPADVEPIDPLAWERTELTPECVEGAVRKAQTELHAVQQLFVDAS